MCGCCVKSVGVVWVRGYGVGMWMLCGVRGYGVGSVGHEGIVWRVWAACLLGVECRVRGNCVENVWVARELCGECGVRGYCV